MNLKKILSLDLGMKNVGISYIEFVINFKECNIKYVKMIKYNWENWNDRKIEYLKDLVEKFNIDNNFIIIIEQQLMLSNLIKMMSFIEGYFSALNNKVIIKKPPSYRKNLKTRKNKKQYSIDKFLNIINKYSINLHNNLNVNKNDLNNINNNKNKLNIDYKYHDMCDSFIISYNYLLENYLIKNIDEINIVFNN